MSKPEFTPDEQFLVDHLKASNPSRGSEAYMWSYVFCTTLLAGCGAYYDNVVIIFIAFIVLVAFRLYEAYSQRHWDPHWQNIIEKYEADVDDTRDTQDHE